MNIRKGDLVRDKTFPHLVGRVVSFRFSPRDGYASHDVMVKLYRDCVMSFDPSWLRVIRRASK